MKQWGNPELFYPIIACEVRTRYLFCNFIVEEGV
jgi:hypothetical protein